MTSPTGRRIRAWVPTLQDIGEAVLTLATTTLGLAVAVWLIDGVRSDNPGSIVLAAVVVAVGDLLLGAPLLLPKGWRTYRAFAGRILLFGILLYTWGCLGDGLFVSIFRDRIYFNRDPIGDFVPWIPSTRYMVDTACGGHPINGATWNTLRLAWAAVAVPVWAAAFWSYGRVLRLTFATAA